jgi:hypothetical protein
MSDLGADNRGEEPKPAMNGRGKSNPAIVAVKSANNAGKPVIPEDLGRRWSFPCNDTD